MTDIIKNREWKTVNLEDGNSFQILSGLWTGKKPPFSKAIVIRNTNFSNNGRVDHSKIAVLDVETKQLENRELQNQDIIVERSGGGPKQPVGRVVLFEKVIDEMPYSFSNFTSVIRVKDKKRYDPIFVFYYLYNFYREGKTDKLQRRTTGIRNLDFNSYKKSVILPDISISKQREVAKVLTTTQGAIAGQEELIEKQKKLKKSMMQYLFTHGTKNEPTKITGIGEIPVGWKISNIGNFCEVKGGKRLPKGEELVSINTGLPYIRVTDFSNNSVNLDNIRYLKPETQKSISRYTISSKDIYISIAGSIGFVGIIPNELENANLTENAAKICLNTEKINQQFLMYWLNSDSVQKDIKSQTVKNAQPKLALSRIQKLPCVVPNYQEQEKISKTIDSINEKIESAQSELSVYQKLFKTLLHEFMSGERRVL